MKERGDELNPIQMGLTDQANYPNLMGRGFIMPDGTSGSPEQPQQELPEAQPLTDPTSGLEGAKKLKGMSGDEKMRYLEELPEKLVLSQLRQSVRELEHRVDPSIKQQIDSLWIQTIGAEEDAASLTGKKLAYEDAIQRLQISAARGKEGEKIGVPENLEDLAKLIMKMSSPEWGVGEDKALIDIIRDESGQERERVNTAHFLEWYRGNIIKIHNADPLTPINFFGDPRMGVVNDVWGSKISFGEVVFQDSLFLDKVANKEGKVEKKVNKDYNLLREQMLMEVFLFSTMRNADIEYTLGRGAGKDMLEALTKNFMTNPLTRSNFFEFIMTLPSMHKESDVDKIAGENDKIHIKKEGNFYMGEAVRRALAAYINIFDADQLAEVLGEDSALLKRNYDEYDAETGNLIKKGSKTVDQKKSEDKLKGEKVGDKEDPWFDDNGNVQYYEIYTSGRLEGKHKTGKDGKLIKTAKGKHSRPHQKYLDHINVFLLPNPNPVQQAEIRERVAQSIMQKTGISYQEAKLAEVWAYSMTHINGVAARNDTQSVAFDYWTRLTNTQDYRKRQKAEKRGAKYGGNFNMEGFKRVGLNFFEGAQTLDGRTIQEVIQGGKGTGTDRIDFEKNAIKKTKWDYEKDEQGNIAFFDEDGNVSKEKSAVDVRYEKVEGSEKIITHYIDASGQEVELNGFHTKVKFEREGGEVKFKVDLQKQFLPNHMNTAVLVYEHLINEVQMNFPSLVKGYDGRGNPILDHEAINKIKSGIEHDIRYSLSTWAEINYADKFVMWERKEVRGESGKLMSKKFKGQELDEEWYVLDKSGRRTETRDEPETYLVSKESTVLESMFGVDALQFIASEIKKRGLNAKQNEDAVIEKITGTGYDGKEQTVGIDFTHKDDEQFRIAIWKGAFDYLIASEIQAHRTRGSGHEWYDTEKMIKATLALKEGEFITPDEIKNIQKETGTTWGKLVGKDMAYIMSQVGIESFWKIMLLIMGESIKDPRK